MYSVSTDLNDYDIEQLLYINWDLSDDDLDISDLENDLGSYDEIVYDINIDENLEDINIFTNLLLIYYF